MKKRENVRCFAHKQIQAVTSEFRNLCLTMKFPSIEIVDIRIQFIKTARSLKRWEKYPAITSFHPSTMISIMVLIWMSTSGEIYLFIVMTMDSYFVEMYRRIEEDSTRFMPSIFNRGSCPKGSVPSSIPFLLNSGQSEGWIVVSE